MVPVSRSGSGASEAMPSLDTAKSALRAEISAINKTRSQLFKAYRSDTEECKRRLDHSTVPDRLYDKEIKKCAKELKKIYDDYARVAEPLSKKSHRLTLELRDLNSLNEIVYRSF